MNGIRTREASLQQHTATLASSLKNVAQEHGAKVPHPLR